MRHTGRRAGRTALLALAVALCTGPPASSPTTTGYAAAAARSTGTASRSAARSTTGSGAGFLTGPAAPSEVTTGGVDVRISAVTPAVARPGQVVTITGTVHNTGSAPVTVPRVRLVRGVQPLRTRGQVTAWAGGDTHATGSVLAQQRIRGQIAPGGYTAYRLRVTRVTSLGRSTWGVLPVSVEAGPAVTHTFLGFQRIKEYVPLRTAWLVPLTLGADPALWGPAGADRERAWTDAIGPESRLQRLITATEASSASWAIDPLLLHAAVLPPTPGATPSPSPSQTPTGAVATLGTEVAAGPQEARLRTELAQRLGGLMRDHGPVILPETDADVAAAAGAPSFDASLRALVAAGASDATAVGGRADLAWPAGGRWTSRTERAVTGLYAAAPAVVIPRSALDAVDPAVGAVARTRTGTRLLVTEDSTSTPLAAATDPKSPRGVGAATQQVIATSAVVLGDSPGLSRSLLLTLPRDADPSVSDTTTLLSTMRSVPWLVPTSVASLITAAAKAPRVTPGGGSLGAGDTPLRTASAVGYARVRTDATVGAQIRADGALVGPRWASALDELLSASWRGMGPAWTGLYSSIADEVDATTTAVHVAPQTITFLADRGRVQLAVVNDLDVEVDHLTVELVPDSPRLRIDSPPSTVRIGPHSRAAITADATALAAGQVRLTARILGPTGVEVGREAVVQVSVTPTGSWIFWALGALAGLAFVLGVVRNVRRRRRARTAASHPALAADRAER